MTTVFDRQLLSASQLTTSDIHDSGLIPILPQSDIRTHTHLDSVADRIGDRSAACSNHFSF